MPLLPALDQQLRSAREAAGEPFIVAHIDTCLPSYLNDHHNRDGELLLGVSVDGTSTIGQVMDELESEFRSYAYEMGESRKGYDHDKAWDAIQRVREENKDRLGMIFDSSLTPFEEGDEEHYDASEWCQAYFLISWEVPDEED
jgi:hypothetical protein